MAARRIPPLLLFASLLLAACGRPAAPDHLRPDEELKAALGLTDADRVHRVLLEGGAVERAIPERVEISPTDYVSFESGDGRVHEVRFLLDSLPAKARTFLVRSRQDASPPLLSRGSRFVVMWDGAPAGRYPFIVEGNSGSARGLVIVRSVP